MTMGIFVKYWFLLSCLPWACDLHGFSAAPGSRSRYRPNLGRLEAIQGSSCPGNRVPELVLGYTTPCSGERFFQLREFHFNNCQTCSRVLGDKITYTPAGVVPATTPRSASVSSATDKGVGGGVPGSAMTGSKDISVCSYGKYDFIDLCKWRQRGRGRPMNGFANL
ncbi:uncharacterized protein LOC106154646 [Lingula anatina]|uniref:Uncharacterized protein LOC106154646 n=1 Tax=Lingula anatina TaxID=7574 RepID=A0A1S3HGA8_LINAN|nr:uncharacterized protein LOC106154646 [Lingula anatina]|eukprot:XP_013384516.1 uncharacterized protein LOC106154646 [Lingula anatina]